MAKFVGPQIARELFQRDLSRQNWELGLLTVVADICGQISKQSFTPYLVGGAVRDLLLLNTDRFRDIDVIVERASKQELEALFVKHKVSRNSFGGIRLYQVAPSRKKIAIDIWALKDTWALRHYSSEASIQTFLKTPFLNIDAIAAKPNRNSTWQVYDRGFTQAVRTRTIAINYEPNPDPLLCAIRAIVIARKLRYRLSIETARYVLRQLEAAPPSEWRAAQIRHYGRESLQKTIVAGIVASISRQLTNKTKPNVSVTPIRHPFV